MRTKKLLSLVLTSMVALSIFTGCSSKGSDENSNVNKDGIKEFSAFYATAGKEVPDNRLKKAIAEKIGAKITETWLTGQTAKERIGVMIAGGEYPDFIDGGDGTQALVDAGALVALDEYIDKYPNIKNLWSESDWDKVRKEDGHIYYIPQFGNIKGKDMQTKHNDEAFWIQKAVLKWANYPTIKTVDEYFDLIEKYKAANPEINGQPTIGFEILSDDWRYFCLENPPLFLAGYPNDGKAAIDPKPGDGTSIDVNKITVKSYDTLPEAKKYFEKLNQMFNKGIIDPETFTSSYDQYVSKLSTGRVLGMVDQGWQFLTAEASLVQQGLDERTYVPLGLTLDPNVTSNYRNRSAINAGGGLGISVNCKDVEGALQAVNDLLSDEVMILRYWGEKDVDYKVGDDGLFYRTEEQRENNRNQDWVNENLCMYTYMPQFKGLLEDGKNSVIPSEQPKEFYDSLKPVDKEILDAYGFKKFTDFMPEPAEKNQPWFPIYSFAGTLTAETPAGIAMQKMDEIKKQWLPKVVMSGTSDFESTWNEYQTTLTTQADVKAYEEALAKEAKRRAELFNK
ncbi:sugar ABC transporter substrate-binding protein [Clostridium sp. D46t1_190503_E9]|uniref:sugar ABC transporter substrate-binding protein n=1 Tax=Clostridium sp. D46t1_190503_E9 TaxID=2787137 RepID=UPI001A9BAEE7|nr:sugar ABC transporter substrate-binding protein [Clostridium sp. D46t1_190503_E9]